MIIFDANGDIAAIIVKDDGSTKCANLEKLDEDLARMDFETQEKIKLLIKAWA